jgi:hypothetical protein
VPYLSDVLAFEQAVIFTLLDRNRRIVRFSSDPLVVLRALAAGRMPESPTRGAYEIEVTPDRLGPGTLDASYALGLDAAARSPSSEEE